MVFFSGDDAEPFNHPSHAPSTSGDVGDWYIFCGLYCVLMYRTAPSWRSKAGVVVLGLVMDVLLLMLFSGLTYSKGAQVHRYGFSAGEPVQH